MLSFFMLVSVSCSMMGEKSNSPSDVVNADGKDLGPDSLKMTQCALDSLTNGFNSKIDTLYGELNKSKQDVIYLQSKVNDIQNSRMIILVLCILCLFISILAIVLVLFFKRNKTNAFEVSDIVGTKISSLQLPENLGKRLARLEQESNRDSGNNQDNHSSLAKLELIERRVARLESRFSSVYSGNLGIAPPTLESDSPQTTSYSEKPSSNIYSNNDNISSHNIEKVLYSGFNNENYFTELYNSQQESCVYKIICKTEKNGEFTLISLDKIQSSNGWQEVVEVETNGECKMEDAQNFTLIEKGQCEKIDDNVWKMTQKLKIKISK